MKRFKKILFVDDAIKGKRVALNRAFKLAKENKARLTVVHVLERLPKKIRNLFKDIPYSELEDSAIQQRLQKIHKILKPFRQNGIKVDIKVLVGKYYIEVIKEVLRNNHDIVMKEAGGIERPKEIFFGSDDINLMRKCPCPVWIIKPHRGKKYAKILAAVDPDPYDGQRSELDNTIMEIATSLAKLEKSELHIMHAWGLYCESVLTGPRFGMSEGELKKLVNDTRVQHKKWLDGLLGKFAEAGARPKVHLVKGRPSRLIPELAKREKIELVIMGTVCRTGMPGFLIGNTAEAVLRKVNCSVLTVKPKGFVSPVRI